MGRDDCLDERGKKGDVIRVAMEQTRLTPGRSMLSIRTAIDLYEAGRLDEAAEVCAAMLRSDSGHFDALHLLGMVKLAQGESNEAARLLTDAVKARPRSHEAALNLGRGLSPAPGRPIDDRAVRAA
jgi:predicted Zn-dependent protease